MKNIVINGLWDFAFRTAEPEMSNFDTVISVPGCFDAVRQYSGKRGFGSFRKKICCGGHVWLNVATGLHAKIYWDKQLVGSSVLPYTREDFIFFAGESREHELIIVTDNFISDVPEEMFKKFYDFYGFGGIYDTVKLTELSQGDILNVAVISKDATTGEAEVTLEFFEKTPQKLVIKIDDGRPQEYPPTKKLQIFVPGKLWSPDSPNLHTLEVNGVIVRFGMRTIDWSGQRLLINDEPIKLVGFNRHEAHPEFGAATPDFLTIADLQMIKDAGYNFIRGCHYPQKETLLDACDQLGLLVWEESLGWGNHEAELANPTFIERQVEQSKKMVAKSVNHPSVIIWGCLNEMHSDTAPARQIFSAIKDGIKSIDSSRPVTFATNRPEIDICLDLVDVIACNVYPGWYDEEAETDGIPNVKPRLRELAKKFTDKPLIISEIGAAAIYGDHSGYRWSEEYQAELITNVLEEIFDNERYTGVAIWQFCDGKTYNCTTKYLTRPRGFNNKGLVSEYRIPKVAWNVASKLVKERRNQAEK